MSSVVVATVTPGEPRLGIWCDRCLLSSRFEVDVFIVSVHGVSKVGTYEGCTENGYEPHEAA